MDEKDIHDICDSQLDNEQASLAGNNEEGFVPGIIPAFYRIEGLYKDPNWNGACVFTPWAYYQYYGDEAVLRQAFPVIERYLAIWIARQQMVSWKIMRRWANGASMGSIHQMCWSLLVHITECS